MQLTLHTVFKSNNRFFKVVSFGWSKNLSDFFEIYEVEEIKNGYRKIYVQSGNPFNRNQDEMNNLLRQGKIEFIKFAE